MRLRRADVNMLICRSLGKRYPNPASEVMPRTPAVMTSSHRNDPFFFAPQALQLSLATNIDQLEQERRINSLTVLSGHEVYIMKEDPQYPISKSGICNNFMPSRVS
jgi:hypothetical protein